MVYFSGPMPMFSLWLYFHNITLYKLSGLSASLLVISLTVCAE
jgi:hypothetical protein